MRRFLFLLVRGARGGRPERRLRSLLDSRPELAARARVAAVPDAAEAVRLLQEDDACLPVAAGGDGTIGLAAGALREAGGDRPLAMLPLGTGNAVAHALGVGRMAAALRALERGTPRPWDVLEIHAAGERRTALATVSVGVESRIIAGIAGGNGSPVVSALAAAATGAIHRTRGLSLDVDGERIVSPDRSVYNAGLYNLPCYAFGRRVVPDADPSDGTATAAVDASAVSYWRRVLGPRPSLPCGVVCREAVFDSPVPVQADGEILPPGRVRVRVVPGGIRVLAPPSPE